jgi:O-antigen/teichoic acid export membrane protein
VQVENLQEDLSRKAVRAGGAAAILSVATQILAFSSFIVLAHLAPPSTFGEYAAAGVLLGTAGLLTEAGMHAAVIQRQDNVEAAATTALIANVVGGVGLAVLAAAAAPLVGLFFDSRTIGLASAALAGTIPVYAIAIVPGAVIRRRVSIRLAVVEPLRVIAYAVAAASMLAAGLGVWGLVLATYAGAVARSAAIWKLSGWRPAPSLASWEMWRSLAGYGRPVVISLLLRDIGFAGMTAFVGRAFGASILGQFRYAQRFVAQTISSITLAGAYVLLPVFARIASDEVRFRAAVSRALGLMTLIVFPLTLVFIPLGRPIARIVLGPEWSDAGPMMMGLAGFGLALAISSVSAEAFKASGRTELLPRLHAITATAPLICMFALLPAGPAWMGVAVSLGLCVEAMYALRALGRISGIPLATILRQIQPALLASLIMMLLILALEKELIHAGSSHGARGVVLLASELSAAALVYIAALAVLSPRSIRVLKTSAGYLRRRS